MSRETSSLFDILDIGAMLLIGNWYRSGGGSKAAQVGSFSDWCLGWHPQAPEPSSLKYFLVLMPLSEINHVNK